MSNLTENYVLSLQDLTREDVPLVGTKAANLGELLRAGFRVPECFVLTTTAFRDFLSVNRLPPSSTPEAVASGEFPRELEVQLRACVRAFNGSALAVRSSAVAEDLPGASYAGQYETVLDVRGEEDVLAAVRKCWASAFGARLIAYRFGRQEGSVAVLIQRMVAPEAAGVVFTANPVTGERDETLVSAVRGLGEGLVSGQTAADEWVVRGSEAICRKATANAIDVHHAREVAATARRVAEHFGSPQDVEWALAGGQVYLLQARPITALPQRPDILVPLEGYWMKDSEHYPTPLTPFGASVYIPAVEFGLNHIFAEFGLLMDGVQMRSLGGEVYSRFIPLGGREQTGQPPPWWVIGIASRLMPAMRRRAAIAERALRSGLMEQLVDRWNAEWRDQFRREADDLRHRDLRVLDDEQLLQHLETVVDFLRRGQVVHFRLWAPYLFTLHELILACQRLLGWTITQSLRLLAGTSDVSSEPGRALRELAAIARRSPAGREALEQGGADTVDRLCKDALEVARAFAAYLDHFGCRTVSYDPGDATLAERPELLAALLRDCLCSERVDAPDANRIREEARAEARAALAQRAAPDRQSFERTLAAAERTYPTREDTIFYADNMPAAVARYAVLEIGRRLVCRGLLPRPDDVAYLELGEMRPALEGRLESPTRLVERRLAERRWVTAHPGPRSYGKKPGPLPDMRALPSALRRVNGPYLLLMQLEANQSSTPRSEGRVVGAAGSPGRYTGKVRVICEESQFHLLRPGEVLVCPSTTPSWSVLFSQAGALVADAGSVLSHAAIIAREYGIPSVVATSEGTSRLRDGQTVTVDGNAGLVEVHA